MCVLFGLVVYLLKVFCCCLFALKGERLEGVWWLALVGTLVEYLLLWFFGTGGGF